MKPRHAAALALSLVAPNVMVACTAQPTVWYLVKPPLHVRPYSESDRAETFNSRTDCLREAARRADMDSDPVPPSDTVEFRGGYWKCVANNDPLAAKLTTSH